jgi:hypothetical protein
MTWADARLKRLAATLLLATIALASTSCTSQQIDHPAEARPLATLRVHIGLYGGPLRPGGGMALQNAPAPRENVTAVDADGREFVALTDATGVATMRLATGRYKVFSTYCGNGPQTAVLTADQSSKVHIVCPVP